MGNGARVQVPPAMRDVIEAILADRDSALSARLAAMEDDLSRASKIITGLMREKHLSLGQDDEVPQEPVDKVWCCQKCGSQQGYYDEANDVLRVRYKEHVVHVHTGIGGWIRLVCRKCGELNVLEYAPSVTEVDGGLPEVSVSGDRLVLDEPLLAELQDIVRRGNGTATVKLTQAPEPSPQ